MTAPATTGLRTFPGLSVQEAVTTALEELPVTDLVYEDFHHARPLTEALVGALRDVAPAQASVLLIGPNLHLATAVSRSGYTAEIWQFAGQVYDAAPPCPVSAVIHAARPFPTPAREYDVMVSSLAIERIRSSPAEVLRTLMAGLSRHGHLIMAVEQPGRLGMRMAGLAGRLETALPGGAEDEAPEISWNWPQDRVCWLLGEAGWSGILRSAGLELICAAYVTGTTATLRAVPLRPLEYASAHAKHLVKAMLPRWRDHLLMVARPASQPLTEGTRRNGQSLKPVPVDEWPTTTGRERALVNLGAINERVLHNVRIGRARSVFGIAALGAGAIALRRALAGRRSPNGR